MNNEILKKNDSFVSAQDVHKIISQNMLADGMKLVLDLENSHDIRIVDALTGDEYLDMFSFFASSPLGMNHPKMHNDEFIYRIGKAALTKPSNSDVYTREMAHFVKTFGEVAMPEHFKHLFLISGGSLAVENALKTAFDWKVRKNFQKGYKEEKGHQVIHFREAFHGRSGYTMSLTNTDPNKIMYFPKFNWPRVLNPKITFPLSENLDHVKQLEEKAINEIYEAIKNHKDDIAAIITEPVQAEGGDNFFRKEFFIKLREIADENEIMLIFDEVQTGIGLTGKMWAYEHYAKPDIVAFGKKMQVCGIMVSDRVDEVEENVFRKSSRINSTWGGNLVDMVRSQKYLEIIIEENLVENSRIVGEYLLHNLEEVQIQFPELVSQARGLGLMCSFDFPTTDQRNKFLQELYDNKVLMLSCGNKSVRFRPPLNVSTANIDEAITIMKKILSKMK
ncbi:putative l-lysine-epsilon aminotransferase (l-lysine aminotransferase) (lysine 6-aminotransferase) [hydrocarbon metagenome]|uniref:L-lysine-epsilon aminotransferase n=1 Tax=hydrocarbon metagenome TaxID=938273 RepID=A0A0W8G1U7_9ZZZZ